MSTCRKDLAIPCRFAASFILACIGIYAFILAIPVHYAELINKHSAWVLGLVLNLIGVPVSVDGSIVFGGGFALQIIPECTPLFMVGLFFCFIIFSRATIRQKVSGLALGIFTLYIGNVVRLVAIFLVGEHDRALFEVAHAFWGQVFTIFLVLLIFILWLESLNRGNSKQYALMKTVRFLGRFVFITGCLFLLWVKIQHGYIWFVDQCAVFAFSFLNYHISITHATAVHYETFSIITFTALIFSIRSLSLGMRIETLAIGLGFLFATHLFHTIDNAFIVHFHVGAAQTAALTLLIIGQYLLPVVFLIALINRR